jgi:hypothetical protein
MNSLKLLGCVSAAALLAATADEALANGKYVSGDFHNHTTCSDGSTSVRTLTDRSLTYLDWFIQAGHSGQGNRDCRFDAPSSGLAATTTYWSDTIGNAAILGLQANGQPQSLTGSMWRWQSLQQYTYPETTEGGEAANKPAFVGLEWVVPGHEHASVSVSTDQFPLVNGNDDGLAQFEYCFASNSNDTSGGAGQGWTCEISAENNQQLINHFKTVSVNQAGVNQAGIPRGPGPLQGDYNATIDPATGINIYDDGDHVKSTAAVRWMKENHRLSSYAVPAHLERAGPFRPGSNNGYNIEHLRDWNNASPAIAFGFESQPGHQASDNRGEYQPSRSGGSVASAGLYTFGGTGCYAAAIAGKPGYDVDGTPLTPADFLPGGRYPEVPNGIAPENVTVCQPGLRTVWDALLSEGRRYFFFASSDWHSRGSFAFNDPETDQDFAPGEYQKYYAYVVNRHVDDPAQDIVDGLRSGNGYAVMGDLIRDLSFKACAGSNCATMGGTLKIANGAEVTVEVRLRDPAGVNHSPYTFPNPALSQMGISEPLNQPSLRYVDLIKGHIHKPYLVTQPEYTDPLAPPVSLWAKFTADGSRKWVKKGEWIEFTYTFQSIREDSYIRLRGSNLPAGTPYERDADGNPLRDDQANNIACTDPACPPHVNGIFDKDVEAWGDLFFYANPIFIQVDGTPSGAASRQAKAGEEG